MFKWMKKKPLTQKQTNTDIYAVTREFSPRLANLFLKSLIISCCGNKIHQGFFFFFHTISSPVVKLYLSFFLKLCDKSRWRHKKEKKYGSFASYLAMLRFESFAFMFKPLPESSTKTEQKHTHTHTHSHTTHRENHDITGSI